MTAVLFTCAGQRVDIMFDDSGDPVVVLAHEVALIATTLRRSPPS